MNEEQKKLFAERLLDYEARPLSTIRYYFENKQALKDSNDWKNDKLYHARANAQAGQIQDVNTALLIDLAREGWDNLRKNTWDKEEGTTPKSIFKDSIKDMKANMYGLQQGLSQPFKNVDNILDKSYLRGLNE